MFVLPLRQLGTASLLSLGLLTTLLSPKANAACLPNGCHRNGLVFSEASSNFQITNITGTGTIQNPFVVYQDVWGLDISLAINGLNTTPQHAVFNRPGFALSIVSRNLTGAFWRFYDHELQETTGVASSENDGLSFAQGIGPARPYTSNYYDRADEITDVRDFINFYRGAGVNPEERVRFNYLVTDTIPNQRFYIRQRPDYRTNEAPTATTTPKAAATPPQAPTPPPSPVKPPQTPQPTPSSAPASPTTVTTPVPGPSTRPPAPEKTPTQVTVAASSPPPSTNPSQSVPEPTTVLGILAIYLSKTYLNKPTKQSQQCID